MISIDIYSLMCDNLITGALKLFKKLDTLDRFCNIFC